MVFAVISFAPGLTPVQHKRAAVGAPPCTDSPAPYPELLEDAGWVVREQRDVTAAFGELCARDLAAFETRAQRLRKLLGDSELSDRLVLRRAKVEGVQEGTIRREVFVATPAAHA
jgi:hypothetical protein